MGSYPLSANNRLNLIQTTIDRIQDHATTTKRSEHVFANNGSHLRAVVGVKVRASVKGAGDTARHTKSLETAGNSSSVRKVLKTLKVDSETSDVRGGHGGTAERSGSRVATDVRRKDTDTRGEDVNASTVVGEGRRAERAIRGGDSESVRSVGRGHARDGKGPAVSVTVAGCDDGEHTLSVGGLNSTCPGGRRSTAQRHVDD